MRGPGREKEIETHEQYQKLIQNPETRFRIIPAVEIILAIEGDSDFCLDKNPGYEKANLVVTPILCG